MSSLAEKKIPVEHFWWIIQSAGMGNEQVFCLLKGRKKDHRKKRRKVMSCLSKADPSEPGFQPTKGSTAWLCRRPAKLLHDCTIPRYKTLCTVESSPPPCSDCCNQGRAHRARFSCGVNPSKSIELKEHTLVTSWQAMEATRVFTLGRV